MSVRVLALVIGVAPVACKKDPPAAAPAAALDPLTLIPTSALTIGGIDLEALRSTPLWQRQEPRVREEGRPTTDALVTCHLDFDRWKRLTLGIGSESDQGVLAVVVEARGIGKAQTLACLSTELARHAGGTPPWTTRAQGSVLEAEDGRVGYVVGDDVLVIADPPWAEAVGALVRSPGPSAATGTVAPAVGRTDMGKHVWFAGKLPTQARALAGSIVPVEQAQDIAGWLDMSSGLEGFVAIGFGSHEQAVAAKEDSERAWTEGQPMAGQLGLPASVRGSVKFGVDGTATTVNAKMSMQDIEAIAARRGGA